MKTRNLRARPALLQCERLENRLALAGNVDVALSAAGDLVVTGDKSANHVEIVGNADGSTTLRGLDNTKIRFNGALDSDATVQITQPLHDLTVNLEKGNDTFLLASTTISGATNIDGRKGNDSITLGSTTSGAPNTVFTGPTDIALGKGGHDVVRIDGTLAASAAAGVLSTTTFGDLSIHGGNGEDCIIASGAAVNGNLSVHTGNGGDLVYVTDSVVSGNLDVQTGNGKDVIQIGGGIGNVFGALGAAGVFVGGTTTINSGNGNDLVAIEGATTFQGVTQINTGNGPDKVAVVDTAVFNANLNVDGGHGPNKLLLDDATVVFNAPAALNATNVKRVAAAHLTDAVNQLNQQILQRAEACLFGHHGKGHHHDDNDQGENGQGDENEQGNGHGHGNGHND